MSRLKSALFCLGIFCSGNVAMAQTPSPIPLAQVSDDDWQAFIGSSKVNKDIASEALKQLSGMIRPGQYDKNAICELSKKAAAAEAKAGDDEQAFLEARQQSGKPIYPLVKAFLQTSAVADTKLITSTRHCAIAATQEFTAETVILMPALTMARANRAAAKPDTLMALRSLQSEGTYLDDLITQLELLRDFSTHYSQDAAALVEKLPDLEKELVAVKADIKTYIDPYKDHYVYTPTVLPAVPDNDEAFQNIWTSAIASAQMPLLHTSHAMASDDKEDYCQLLKYSQDEAARLQKFAQAYVDQQSTAGKNIDAGQKALKESKALAYYSSTLVQRVCS